MVPCIGREAALGSAFDGHVVAPRQSAQLRDSLFEYSKEGISHG
jgi:hypothetical protein